MRQILMVWAVGIVLLAALAAAAGAAVGSLLGQDSEGGAPTATASSQIPAAYLQLFMQAAATCPGLPWAVLAGIGKEETDFGQITDMVSPAGAVGPMQFEPATFAEYGNPVPPGGASPATPWDPTDAIYAAARMLCANGARNGANIYQAVYAYNHADWYVADVLNYAAQYSSPGYANPSSAAQTAISYAQAQLGIPYQYGGDGPGVNGSTGFDCSGLTQAAYKAAGITLPRVAQDQYDATKNNPTGGTIQPGDLVFFGTSLSNISHVGIYIGSNLMIDAPHTGADVRIEDYRWSDLLAYTNPL